MDNYIFARAIETKLLLPQIVFICYPALKSLLKQLIDHVSIVHILGYEGY